SKTAKDPHISKIFHEKTFGRKNANFERVRQMTGFQSIDLKMPQKPLRWLEKVNAPEKFGVAVF
ncbi:MAG: hypothetical protein IJ892_06190, partial [Prevotella sp.]|nr:hypothetical protein [Prevotella sp.]